MEKKLSLIKKIPTGYKQTEIGVIPEDWDVKELGELVEVKDGTHQTPKYFDSGIPFYSVENITNNDFTNTKYISEAEHKLLTNKFKIEKMDILMTRIGSIGDCKLITWSPNASFYVSLALLKPKNKLTASYIYQFSKTDIFKKALENRSLQWAIPKKINLGEISKVNIIIPKKIPEQNAISTILSETEALIERLEKLIAKKKAIKQGAMQQLLTGKKRLPRFSGEWNYISLEAIAQRKDYSIVDGPFGSQMKVDEFVGAGVPVVEMEHLEDKQSLGIVSRFITNQKFKIIKRSAIYPGDIIISKTGTLGLLGIVSASISKGIITSRLAKISIDRLRADIGFVFHWLRKLKIDGYWEKVSQGGTMQILGIRMLKETPFPHISVLEQIAIATILSDMDAEIESLEQKRDKYTMLKQGMMQQLLTGRIRIYANN